MPKYFPPIIYSFLAFALALIPSLGFSQDEVRLKDGGRLEGKIIRESDTLIELRHESFGVIKIEKHRILSAGAYGTLDSDETSASAGSGDEGETRAASEARRSTGDNAVSRLDLDYEPEAYEPVPVPGRHRRIRGRSISGQRCVPAPISPGFMKHSSTVK